MKKSANYKKIIFVLWSGKQFGGLQRRYVRLAEHISLNFSNIKVTILCQHRCLNEAKVYLVNSKSVNLKPFGIKRKRSSILASIFDLCNLILLLRLTSQCNVHFCMNPGFVSGFAALFKKISHKFSVTNAYLFTDLPLSFIERWGLINSVKRVNKIDCLSNEPVEVISDLMGSRNKILFSDKIRIAPCSFTDTSLVEHHQERDIDVLMLARYVEGKGYDLLEEINSFFSEINLHLCGSGPLDIRIKNGLQYETKAPFSVLGRSKIFLSLQKTENYPSQSLLEAMASGCAIIATDVGETRKMLNEHCAILIPYCSNALKEAISFLLDNPSLCKKMGNVAIKRLKEEHNVNVYADYFLSEVI